MNPAEQLTVHLPFISDHPLMIVALAPGGFFIFACAIAVVNKILTSKGKPREFGCQGCAMASICQQEKRQGICRKERKLMGEYLTILLGIILVNNYVLAQFLGICPFLGVSKHLTLL